MTICIAVSGIISIALPPLTYTFPCFYEAKFKNENNQTGKINITKKNPITVSKDLYN